MKRESKMSFLLGVPVFRISVLFLTLLVVLVSAEENEFAEFDSDFVDFNAEDDFADEDFAEFDSDQQNDHKVKEKNFAVNEENDFEEFDNGFEDFNSKDLEENDFADAKQSDFAEFDSDKQNDNSVEEKNFVDKEDENDFEEFDNGFEDFNSEDLEENDFADEKEHDFAEFDSDQQKDNNEEENEFADVEQNEFAEFDFDDEADESSKVDNNEDDEEEPFVFDSNDEEDDVVVEEDPNEFNHFLDEDEFVGLGDKDEDEFINVRVDKPSQEHKIKIVNIPSHLRPNFENYYLEILMVFGIVVYFLNFFSGKAKNQKIANSWLDRHRSLLESQFSLVGDDGSKNVSDIEEPMSKDSENLFSLWCSGRMCCEGMLIELKLLKRQDLIGVISNVLKPAYDQVHIRVDLAPDDMDNFIFCIASKKSAVRLSKDMNDISTYCPERRPAEKYNIPGNYVVMSEVPEVASAMLDAKLISMFKKLPDAIDTIHFSDQFTGPKPLDGQAPLELPVGQNVLIFVFNILDKNKTKDQAIEESKPLMDLVFYCLEKVKRYKVSKEARSKAEKNRSKVADNHWKSIHLDKAQKAAEEKERKRREIKDKIREIEDPEKQRKMEEKNNQREKKKSAPKMRQMKVKSM